MKYLKTVRDLALAYFPDNEPKTAQQKLAKWMRVVQAPVQTGASGVETLSKGNYAQTGCLHYRSCRGTR